MNTKKIETNENIINRDFVSNVGDIKSMGYKVDLWYDGGKLDAVCIAKWEGGDLNHKKTFKIDDIAVALLNLYLIGENNEY